jgi:hypothetical protein
MKKLAYAIVLLNLLPLSGLAEPYKTSSIKPFAELLLWRASETNASWATTISFPGNSVSVIQSSPNFNTNAGVRAGLIYSPCDFWDTTLAYTYYATKSNNGVALAPQIVSSLFFSGSFFISGDLYFGGNADWSLTMNMLDFEISHAFQPNSHLSLAPRIGIKTGTINQSININWNAFLYQSTEKLNNDFFGIGPSFGLNAMWHFTPDLSLVGDVSTALMYGRWHDDDVYQRPASLVTTATTISSNATRGKLGTFMMDYYLGLEWLHRGKSNVAVRLGYEMQYWPNQLRLVAVQQLPTFGDLTFQGATCNVTIDL